MNGEHLWLETNVSGDLCYLGEENCQVRFAVSVRLRPLGSDLVGEVGEVGGKGVAAKWSLKTVGSRCLNFQGEFERACSLDRESVSS